MHQSDLVAGRSDPEDANRSNSSGAEDTFLKALMTRLLGCLIIQLMKEGNNTNTLEKSLNLLLM